MDDEEIKKFRVCKVRLAPDNVERAGEMLGSFDTLADAIVFSRKPSQRRSLVKIYVQKPGSHVLIEMWPRDRREAPGNSST